MKKIYRLAGLFLLVGSLSFACVVPMVHAADAGTTVLEGLDKAAGTEGAGFDTEGSDVATVIARLVNIVMTVSGIVFLIMLVYGGILYLLAAGSEETVKKAKRLITSSIIGLIIIMSSYAISFYVFEKLIGITGESYVF